MVQLFDIPDWSGSALNATQLLSANASYLLTASTQMVVLANSGSKTVILYLVTFTCSTGTSGQISLKDDANNIYFLYSCQGTRTIPHNYGGQALPVGRGLIVRNDGVGMATTDQVNILYQLR